MAKITISANNDLKLVSELAGSSEIPIYQYGELIVNDVTQEALELAVIQYNSTLLDRAKSGKLNSLRLKFSAIVNGKPRVPTSLGFDVDGGRDNKDDFFSKWESMADTDVTTVRDADNQFHPNTTKAQMQTIYRAIVANGEALLQWKWQKEVEINACTAVAQLEAVVL